MYVFTTSRIDNFFNLIYIFEFAKVILEEVPRKFNKGDIVTQTLKFKAYYSETDSSMLTSTVRNTVASY